MPDDAPRTVIEGLPDAIRVVPPSPLGPGNEAEDNRRRQAWHDWAEQVSRYRIDVIREIRNDPRRKQIERGFCRHSKPYFMAVWGWIFEPRTDPRYHISSGDKPWIPYEIQVQMLNWMDERMVASGADRDGVVSKSRTMGASWVTCAWATHGWIFEYPWNIFFMSRVGELVDSKKQDSLFWKIEFFMRRLPSWLMPDGFSLEDKTLNSENILINPVNGNQITGGSTTTDAGRGGRFTAVIVDEAAKVPDLNAVVSGISATTFHTFLISSESNQLGPDFYNIGMGNTNPYRPSLLAMDWWKNPFNTPEFMEEERQRFEARGQLEDFHREYLRDARAGGSQHVYPYAVNLTTSNEVQFDEMGKLYASIDPGFHDETAIVWIQQQGDKWAVLASYQSRGKEAGFYASIITGIPARVALTGHDGEPLLDEHGEILTREQYEYGPRERALMQWTTELPTGYLSNGSFFGDFSGKAKYGNSQDSFYDVLREKGGIFVNADRNDVGNLISDRKRAREIQPRIEFTRQMLPNFIFSTDRQAPFVLLCLKESTYTEETGRSTTEPKAPRHDEHSHMRSAVEYFCAHIQLRHGLEELSAIQQQQRAYRNSRDLSPLNPSYRNFGRKRLTGIEV